MSLSGQDGIMELLSRATLTQIGQQGREDIKPLTSLPEGRVWPISHLVAITNLALFYYSLPCGFPTT